ncbi:hypothetical protein ACYCAX_04550 [Pseudomonas sp. MT3]|uniref:hypothetical protein n=1 Tax=Pseudomonas sp. ATCC 13867 TaxID=1294143 RepID=UPI0002C4F4CC|nr:hypothetical protein [Pseudomonas sp. ATCC 13867]AGI25849.1 hypothetical protein H681_19910 [Pseudomonas sp. ATCC 13867]RFQ40640.1 hypothetical protein D0N87_03345 [Pseudomonas sp. ATCC 13867]
MPLRVIIPVRQPQGSLLYRVLLHLRRDFAWVAVPLLLLLLAGGAAGCYFAWLIRHWLPAAGAVAALLLAVGLLLFWGEYDWWLFKLGPREDVNLPLR